MQSSVHCGPVSRNTVPNTPMHTSILLTVSRGDSAAHILPHHEQPQQALVGHQKPPEVLSGFQERIRNKEVPGFGCCYFVCLYSFPWSLFLLSYQLSSKFATIQTIDILKATQTAILFSKYAAAFKRKMTPAFINEITKSICSILSSKPHLQTNTYSNIYKCLHICVCCVQDHQFRILGKLYLNVQNRIEVGLKNKAHKAATAASIARQTPVMPACCSPAPALKVLHYGFRNLQDSIANDKAKGKGQRAASRMLSVSLSPPLFLSSPYSSSLLQLSTEIYTEYCHAMAFKN